MSRSRHIGLEQEDDVTLPGAGARSAARRRAALEEELALAFAAGDRERVSELHQALEEVDGAVVEGRSRAVAGD